MQMRDPKGALVLDEPSTTRWDTFAEHPFGADLFPPSARGWSRTREAGADGASTLE
jgi:hypothetical protein